MKLPNGYGSVYKLSGNRRNPYAARKTLGWSFDEITGKSNPIYKFIGYYPTKKEALQALAKYNENPYAIDENPSFSELYEKWSANFYSNCTESYRKVCQASYKALQSIWTIKVKDIRLEHLQAAFDHSGKNLPTLKKMKQLLGLMYDYALMNDIVSPARREMINHVVLTADNPNKLKRIPFTDEEIKTIWGHSEEPTAQIVLIMIYTSMRISEMMNLLSEDVHLDERYIYIRKSKTKAGIRNIPIAEKIVPLLKQWLDRNTSYLFTSESKEPYYDTLFRLHRFNPLMEQLGMQHRPHDCRHTCVSLLVRSGADMLLIRKIVGHAGDSVTENVYTHVDLALLLDAINKI